MEVQREIESNRRRMEIQAQQTANERQYLEELRHRMDKERQSAEASAQQAAIEEKRELLRAGEQLEKDKGALMDERRKNNGIGKNDGGCCSTMKTSCRRRMYH